MNDANADMLVTFLRNKHAIRSKGAVMLAIARQVEIARRLRVAEALAALCELHPEDRAVVARLLRSHGLHDAARDVWPAGAV